MSGYWLLSPWEPLASIAIVIIIPIEIEIVTRLSSILLDWRTNPDNYVKHLIDRYNEYKEGDVGKSKMNYAAIWGIIKKEFKASAY